MESEVQMMHGTIFFVVLVPIIGKSWIHPVATPRRRLDSCAGLLDRAEVVFLTEPNPQDLAGARYEPPADFVASRMGDDPGSSLRFYRRGCGPQLSREC